MIKGAVIFAVGASSGLAIGGLLGLIAGFNTAKDVQQVAIDKMNNKAVIYDPS